MKQDWLIPVQCEINSIFENEPNMNDVSELSHLINIFRYIKAEESNCDMKQDIDSDNENDLIQIINQKLQMAERDLKEYQDTEDRDYIQMAYDLFTHCRKLIGIAKEKNIDASFYELSLKDLENKISKL